MLNLHVDYSGSRKVSMKNLIKNSFLNPHVGKDNLILREKWLEDTLQKVPIGSRILDAGAGELKYKKFCSHLNYVSQDFAKYNGQGDGVGLQTGDWDQTHLDIICNITDVPEPNQSFDAIMCIEVLEHLPDPVAALREFSRLLKSGGLLILTAPFNSLTHLAPFHFYTGYSQYFYNKWLPNLGFKILNLESNGNYFEYLAQETWRTPEIIRKYTGISQNLAESILFYLFLKLLEKYSKIDRGSSQLLCYGYHVFAQKVEES